MSRAEIEKEREEAARRGVKDPKDIFRAEMIGGSPIGLPAVLTKKVLAKVLAREITIDQATGFLAKTLQKKKVPVSDSLTMAKKEIQGALAKIKK